MTFWDRVLAGKVTVRKAEEPVRPAQPKRRHGKRHSVNRERSQIAAGKARRAAAQRAAADDARASFLAEVRRYWRGERPDHP